MNSSVKFSVEVDSWGKIETDSVVDMLSGAPVKLCEICPRVVEKTPDELTASVVSMLGRTVVDN